ncbi:MAG: hypothetical protein M0Q40_10945 [Limnochordia bacterium]|nr:hypothetical protein [Limnochordia bacterium]
MRKLNLFAVLSLVVILSITSIAIGQELKFEAKKTKDTIVIDGNLSDWDGLPSLVLELTDGGKASLKAQWNKDFLFFAVVVEDEVQRNSATGDGIWQGDSVQISLDTLNNKSVKAYDRDDFEFGFALTDKGLACHAWQVSSQVTFDPKKISYEIVRSTENNVAVTVYEIAIPAAQLLPAKLESNYVMGFNWLVNDDDGAGRQFVEWTEGIGISKDPSQYGSLVLVD